MPNYTVEEFGFYYLFPILHCFKCRYYFLLPYAEMPRIAGDQWPESPTRDLLTWPEETWSELFGCQQCGRIQRYGYRDLSYSSMWKEDAGLYHSGGDLFVVAVECARGDCRAPAKLHVQRDTHRRTASSEAEVVKALSAGFFRGRLPCGHDLIPIPKSKYKVYLTNNRLW